MPTPTPLLIHCSEGAERNGVRKESQESEAANSKCARTTLCIPHGYAGQLCSHARTRTERSRRTLPQKQSQRKATPLVTLLSDTHSLVQRQERGHTNRSSLVRDSVSELGGEAKKKKKEKNVKLIRNLETHPKQTI